MNDETAPAISVPAGAEVIHPSDAYLSVETEAIAPEAESKPCVLLIGPEDEERLQLEKDLREAGIGVVGMFSECEMPDVVLFACAAGDDVAASVEKVRSCWGAKGPRLIAAMPFAGRRVRSAVEAGADDVVTLPFDRDECLARVQLNLRAIAVRREAELANARSEESMRLYSEARRAWRVRDEFLSMASHELRTPLTPLAGQFQMLHQFAEDAFVKGLVPKATMRLFESSGRQLARLNRLVGDLLDVSRAPFARLRVEPKEFDAREMLRSLIEQFAPQAAIVGCELELDAPDPQPVYWDRMRMEQVVSNLLSNAFRYAPGAPVSLLLRSDKGGSDACGESVRLSVEDRGMGIDPSDHTRIFQRFERAVPSEHFGGFGLGLAITSDIVAAHGGHVAVESERGRGAKFLLTVPARFTPPEQGGVGMPSEGPPFPMDTPA